MCNVVMRCTTFTNAACGPPAKSLRREGACEYQPRCRSGICVAQDGRPAENGAVERLGSF